METGQSKILFQTEPGQIPALTFVRASLSADGTRAIFFWDAGYPAVQTPGYIWDQSKSKPEIIEAMPEGPASAVPSYGGATAWIFTQTNRLLRLNLIQNETNEILEAFPRRLFYSFGGAVPGSTITLDGSAPLAGQHFRTKDLEFPIVPANQPNLTAIQLPWELESILPHNGSVTLPIVVQKDGHPFELQLDLAATNQPRFQFERLNLPNSSDTPMALAASQDFRYVIDQAHPARAGETIHTWLTGMGPLDRPVPTGEAGSTANPSRPRVPPGMCNLRQRRQSSLARIRNPLLRIRAWPPGVLSSGSHHSHKLA